MGRTVQLGTVVDRCQKRSDLENQASISDDDWKELISAVYAELYGELCKPGVGYFDVTDTITTTGVAAYTLPTDHIATIAVSEVMNAAGQLRPLAELMVQERHLFKGITGPAMAYRFQGTQIVLYPTPPAGKTYEHVYVPAPPDLSTANDATLIEMATPDGEQFLIWGVCAAALHRLEMDPRFATSKQEAARERVVEWACIRSLNSAPRRIVVDEGDEIYDPASFRWNPA